uniref:Uncharacterized protein n=1 Tax=Arundo donax TaxID=35708 RepID=A0A0A9CT22_ARUDO
MPSTSSTTPSTPSRPSAPASSPAPISSRSPQVRWSVVGGARGSPGRARVSGERDDDAAGADVQLRAAEAGVPRPWAVHQGPGGAVGRPHAGLRALLLLPEPHPHQRPGPGGGPGPEPLLRGVTPPGVPRQQHRPRRRLRPGRDVHGLRQRLLPDAADQEGPALLRRGAADAPQDPRLRGALRRVAGDLLQGLRQVHAPDGRAQRRRRGPSKLQARQQVTHGS